MIRVLALNDDNHDTSFACEDGRTFTRASTFITECLAKPHSEEYIVRGFCIIDEVRGPLAAYNNDDIDAMFYALEDVARYEGKDFLEMFNLLWESSSERWR